MFHYKTKEEKNVNISIHEEKFDKIQLFIENICRSGIEGNISK